MKKFSSILLAINLFALSGIVSAVPIGATIEFSGSYTTDTGNKDTATVFMFNNPITVEAAAESFAPLSGGNVHYNDLDINDLPASPLWYATIGIVNYSFDLNSITYDNVITTRYSSYRFIEGIGTFTIGTESSSGFWSFSTQGGGSNGIYSFSASNAPGPAPLILMGLGLFGISVSHKLRKA
jgi:hypothetical protein